MARAVAVDGVVFTVPGRVRRCRHQNKAAVYGILFKAVS